MAPKKSKGQKVALGDWLTEDAGTSSWADEMDAMPTAPGEFQDMGFKRGGGAGGDRPGFGAREGGGGFGDRDSRPPRADVPFPTEPPYTAFVGNMSFECTQEDVNEFFTNESLTVSNVRMVSDFNGKSKGFCYAEFPEADMLRHALTLSGAQLGGRTVRISVAEPPRADASGRSNGDWTRSGPLADLPGRGGPRPGGNRFEGAGGPPVDSGRDWGEARGSKFAPSAPSSPALGGGRPGFGDRRDPSGGAPRMGGFREREGMPPSPVVDDRDWGAARGGKFAPAPPAPERKSGFADRKPSQPEEARDWRARTAPMSPPLSDSSSPATAAAPSAPAERKRLNLSARTVSSSSSPAADVTSPPSNKPNPFGSAVPVDTTAREAAIAERAAKEKADAEEAKKAAVASEENTVSPPAKKTSNPFGSAKPVDNSSREKEVEAKLAKDKEELEKKMKEAKIVEDKSATPQREWRRPSGPNAGLTGSTANAPQSEIAKSSTATETTSAPATQPKQILKNQGIRREGFSYSNVAGTISKASTEEEQANGSEKAD